MNAYLGCTYHDLSRIRCKPNFSVTSAGDIAGRPLAMTQQIMCKGCDYTSRQILFVRENQ